MAKNKEYSTLQLRQRLVAAGVDPEKFDVHSNVDRKLTQRENFINLTKMTGTAKPKQYREERHTQTTLKGEFYQIGKSNKKVDEGRKSKPPGVRYVRHPGKVTTKYVERRKNRSDRPGWRI